MNLYEIHRMIANRQRSDSDCDLKAEIRQLSSTMFDPGVREDEILEIISEIKELEKELPRHLKRYGIVMERVVLSGNYTAERPYQIRHRYEEKGKAGNIYILTAPSRPKQCKIGATTLDMTKRCRLYRCKYGYEVEVAFSLWIVAPFTLENQVKQKAAHLRVCGNTIGDSIEWYRAEPGQMRSLIDDALSEHT